MNELSLLGVLIFAAVVAALAERVLVGLIESLGGEIEEITEERL